MAADTGRSTLSDGAFTILSSTNSVVEPAPMTFSPNTAQLPHRGRHLRQARAATPGLMVHFHRYEHIRPSAVGRRPKRRSRRALAREVLVEALLAPGYVQAPILEESRPPPIAMSHRFQGGVTPVSRETASPSERTVSSSGRLPCAAITDPSPVISRSAPPFSMTSPAENAISMATLDVRVDSPDSGVKTPTVPCSRFSIS